MFSYTDTIAKVIKVNPIDLELFDTKIKHLQKSNLFKQKCNSIYIVQLQYQHNTSINGPHNNLSVVAPTTSILTILDNGEHKHEIKGISEFIIYQGLPLYDLVIVLQLQGVKKYYILDEVYKNENYEPANHL